jgi:hypothetical protein
MKPFHRCLLTLLCVVAVGCTEEEPVSPEDQIRAVITRAERDAEEQHLEGLRDLISDEYAGPRGENKGALLTLMQYYLARHRAIEMLTRVETITFDTPSQARASILVIMGGVASTEDLSRLRGDVYRITCSLADEGDGAWKITRAAWERALADDIR